jgi:hypothetical protein
MDNQNPNLNNLLIIVNELEELTQEMVFLGGCAAGLLITDAAAPKIRVTIDVDVIVQVVTKGEYYQLAEKLRDKGFAEDTQKGAPICRWKSKQGILLDIMLIDPEVLGFGNPWYQPAMQHAEEFELEKSKIIQLVSAPYFLITKLEAFAGRGNNDYLLSHDIEDIVAIFDGRPELMNEIMETEDKLKHALSERFKEHLANDRFIESIQGHLPADEVNRQRAQKILEDMQLIAKI